MKMIYPDSVSTTKQEAEEEGRTARREGNRCCTNPYCCCNKTGLKEAWDKGWEDEDLVLRLGED